MDPTFGNEALSVTNVTPDPADAPAPEPARKAPRPAADAPVAPAPDPVPVTVVEATELSHPDNIMNALAPDHPDYCAPEPPALG